MDQMKEQIQRKLIGNMISDWCGQQDWLIFRPSLCTQERCIRFTTPKLNECFPPLSEPRGAWKSENLALYEIYNTEKDFRIVCSVSRVGLSSKQLRKIEKVASDIDGTTVGIAETICLREWCYPSSVGDSVKIMDALNGLQEKLAKFEARLAQSLMTDELKEGTAIEVRLNRYERNRKARQKCIEIHGTSCKICGFDFGKAYGDMLDGIIEVHHIIPLNQIGKEYRINPETDLIPVCSNCHTAIHSRQGDPYTIEEVKMMLRPKEG